MEAQWLGSAQLLDWWQAYGRHDIPWKRSPAGGLPEGTDVLDPYPIWVAEVMQYSSTYRTSLAVSGEPLHR